MLYYFPRRYDDYSELKPINRIEYGEELTILGSIRSISSHKARNRRMEITEAVISDGTGFLRLIWFNQPFIQKSLKPKTQIVVSGKIDQYLGHLVIKNPDWERLEKEKSAHKPDRTGLPPLTAGIHQRWLRRLMYKTISFWAPRILDYLPEDIRASENFYLLSEAVQQIHFPDSFETLTAARKRLAFDEIFLLQLGVLNQKYEWNQVEAQKHSVSEDWYQSLLKTLPFELTNSQKNAIEAVRNEPFFRETDEPLITRGCWVWKDYGCRVCSRDHPGKPGSGCYYGPHQHSCRTALSQYAKTIVQSNKWRTGPAGK